ncbi:hypothetical protein [Halobacteriovorax marinus]|uniref:hypothetical protein n=1 Tax=Halobacteriovorax marinus TaxID=97084 RepID=UPI001F44938F|nr:hypothetical protein [Halobacteriovorax marinus]
MWLTYEPKVFMGNMEPPFPNWFEVMWSLKGPDRNKNGIRDDVEIYINNEFKDLNESELIMIYNAAVIVQASLNLRASKDSLEKYWVDSNVITECFGKYSSSTGDFDNKFKQLIILDREVRSRTRNTFLRSNISRIFLNNFHMWSYERDGLRTIYLKLNMDKICGLKKEVSDKIAAEFLRNELKFFKKYQIYNYFKFYEDEYGKVNRNIYEKYLK